MGSLKKEIQTVVYNKHVYDKAGVFVRVPLTLKEAFDWFKKNESIYIHEDLHILLTIASWLCIQNVQGSLPLEQKSPVNGLETEELMAWMSISCFIICRELGEVFDILQKTLRQMPSFSKMNGPVTPRTLSKNGLRRLKNHPSKHSLAKAIIMSQNHLKKVKMINEQFDSFDLFEQPMFKAIDSFIKYSGTTSSKVHECIPQQWRSVIIDAIEFLYPPKKERTFDFYRNFKFHFYYEFAIKRHVDLFNFLHGGIYFVDKKDVSQLYQPFLDLKSNSFLLGVETMEKLRQANETQATEQN